MSRREEIEEHYRFHAEAHPVTAVYIGAVADLLAFIARSNGANGGYVGSFRVELWNRRHDGATAALAVFSLAEAQALAALLKQAIP